MCPPWPQKMQSCHLKFPSSPSTDHGYSKMKTWKDAFQFFPVWGSRSIKDDLLANLLYHLLSSIFWGEWEENGICDFCKSAKTPWVFWWVKSKGFLKIKNLEILRFQWGRKVFWWVSPDNSAERCFHIRDVQGTTPDSEDQITIYGVPFYFSIWRSLVAAPRLCPQWIYREPMEESELFTPTLSPSKEAKGKGDSKMQLLVPLRIQPKPA